MPTAKQDIAARLRLAAFATVTPKLGPVGQGTAPVADASFAMIEVEHPQAARLLEALA